MSSGLSAFALAEVSGLTEHRLGEVYEDYTVCDHPISDYLVWLSKWFAFEKRMPSHHEVTVGASVLVNTDGSVTPWLTVFGSSTDTWSAGGADFRLSDLSSRVSSVLARVQRHVTYAEEAKFNYLDISYDDYITLFTLPLVFALAFVDADVTLPITAPGIYAESRVKVTDGRVGGVSISDFSVGRRS